MPTEYKRKLGSTRGSWDEQDLIKAITAVSNNTMGVNEAARYYNIPTTTLKRRIKNKKTTKDSFGRGSILGQKNEEKLLKHITKLQASGFTPTRDTVRAMAYKLAEQLKIDHSFNRESEMAGYDWLVSFLRRNPKLSIRKSEGVSKNRALGMNKMVVNEYFDLLEKTLIENDLIGKPGHVFNMDESGLQLNNKPGDVVAVKGSKCVSTITSGEKGETISVVCCINGEGGYTPPYCIFKGKNRKPEFSDGMPPGSSVVMSQKSAYMNSDLFFDWLKTQFLPRKPPGKVVLILDGHTSHCSAVDMLEFADSHDIILLGLPSHTSHFLQPLDRSFFKSLKSNYNAACSNFMKNNPSRQISRLQFGNLLGIAWSKAASVDNALSGFKRCGIVPLDRSAIPEYAYLTQELTEAGQEHTVVIDASSSSKNSTNISPVGEESSKTVPQNSDVLAPEVELLYPNIDNSLARPGTSTGNGLNADREDQPCGSENLTPSKLLDIISPVPSLKKKITVRGKAASVSKILNSPENIQRIISVKEEKEKKLKDKEERKNKRELKRSLTGQNLKKERPIKKKCLNPLKKFEMCVDSDEDVLEFNENECVGCTEDYNQTTSTEDWIKCTKCSRWLHENCTKYGDICDFCGKKELKLKKLLSVKIKTEKK